MPCGRRILTLGKNKSDPYGSVEGFLMCDSLPSEERIFKCDSQIAYFIIPKRQFRRKIETRAHRRTCTNSFATSFFDLPQLTFVDKSAAAAAAVANVELLRVSSRAVYCIH